jgi:hypothetical protein
MEKRKLRKGRGVTVMVFVIRFTRSESQKVGNRVALSPLSSSAQDSEKSDLESTLGRSESPAVLGVYSDKVLDH